MMFMLGFFCALLLSLLVFVIEIYLIRKNGGLKVIVDKVESGTRAKGSIFFPKPDAIRSAEEKIRENEKEGKDTNIDDLIS